MQAKISEKEMTLLCEYLDNELSIKDARDLRSACSNPPS